MGYYSGLGVMVMNCKITLHQLVTLNVCGTTASLIKSGEWCALNVCGTTASLIKSGEWCALNIAVQLDVHIIVMYYIIFKLQ